MKELPLNRGYKETTCYFLNRNCMVMTNNDVEITDEIRYALGVVKQIHRNHCVDEVVDKWNDKATSTSPAR